MSGGSFEYLYRRDDEVDELVPEIEAMAAALAKFPRMQKETQAVADALKAAAAEVRRLSTLWHNVEWNVSGDWPRARIREEAIKLGELLPACEHSEVYSYSSATEMGRACEGCGEKFDVRPRAVAQR